MNTCSHCKTPFEQGDIPSPFCSDQCLFAAHPELIRPRDVNVRLTQEQKREATWEASLDARQRGYNFALLKPNAKAAGRRLIETWTGQSVLFLGASESCKTYLAYRLARVAHMKGNSVVHTSAEELRAAWLEERKTIEKARSADVLLLDDLGMENATDGWVSAVYDVLKHREDHERATLVTANRAREFFEERYGLPVANRLFRMEVVEL